MRARSLLLVLATLALGGAPARVADADEGWWLDDYAAALAQAKEANKPLLVGFR